MAKIYYRGNLSAAIFPMTLAGAGRAVIMPGPDNNFDRRVDPAGEQKDAGIPQAIYMENVFPTVSGYQSVGYLQPKIPPPLPALVDLLTCIEMDVKIGDTFTKVPVFNTTGAGVYLSGYTATGVVTVVGTDPGPGFRQFGSTAVVNDVAYFYISNEIYEVTGTDPENITLTNVTASVTPNGFFTDEQIVGIAGSNNYLIAASATRIYYSSLTTSLDFVSSLISGAGVIRPNDLKGSMVRLSETQGGFYILASETTLLAKYTGNNRYPWKFVPIKNLSGRPSRVGSFYGNIQSKGQYVLDTNNQIKFINEDTAEDFAPEVSEFLANAVVQQGYSTSLKSFFEGRRVTKEAQIYVLHDRYVFVSLDNVNSAAVYQTVLVYDILLKRYGRLNIVHTQIFEVDAIRTNLAGAGNTRKTVGFVDNSNNIYFLSLGPYSADAEYERYNILEQQAVLVLGKFQYARSRWIKLHEIEVEGTRSLQVTPLGINFNLSLLTSLDGYNLLPGRSLIASLNNRALAKFPAHDTAQNFVLVAEGSFDLSTIQLTFSTAGER